MVATNHLLTRVTETILGTLVDRQRCKQKGDNAKTAVRYNYRQAGKQACRRAGVQAGTKTAIDAGAETSLQCVALYLLLIFLYQGRVVQPG